MITQPMGAATVTDLATQVRFPVYVSRKLDGIRCSVLAGTAFSKKMKPLPNRWLQEQVSRGDYDGLDFEVVVGVPCAMDVWNKSQSFAMSRDKLPADFAEDKVTFFVFDDHSTAAVKQSRLRDAQHRCKSLKHCEFVKHYVCKDALQVMEFETTFVMEGYEGIMLSSPQALYKEGRATITRQELMKYKRFVDSEAVVVGFREEMHNANEAEVNELGNSKRSSHKANKRGKNTMGVLVGRDLESGLEVNCGIGFSAELRADIWVRQAAYLGKVFTYRHQAVAVEGGKVRFGSYKGWRNEVEL